MQGEVWGWCCWVVSFAQLGQIMGPEGWDSMAVRRYDNVTDTMSSQGARVLRKRRRKIATRGCGVVQKISVKWTRYDSQSRTYLHSSWRSASTPNVVTAANEYMSGAKGDQADELVVVEIKEFVWWKLGKVLRRTYSNPVLTGSICERCIHIFISLVELTSLRPKRTTPRAAAFHGSPFSPITPSSTNSTGTSPLISIGTLHLHDTMSLCPPRI